MTHTAASALSGGISSVFVVFVILCILFGVHWVVGDVDRAERDRITAPILRNGWSIETAGGHLLADLVAAGGER